jgi:hypothetical protein
MQTPTLKTLKSMHDELKLKIHLAGLEVRSEWEELEPRLEKALNNAAEATTEALEDLQIRLEAIRRRLN